MRTGLAVLIVAVVACAGPGGSAVPARPHHDVTRSLVADVAGALVARGPTRLAVLPLDAEGDVAISVGGLILDRVSTELAQQPQITFVERAKLEALIAEMALQQSGLISDADQIEMGQMAGAEVVLGVRATFVGEALEISTRLLDVAKGVVITASNLRVAYDDELKTAIADRNARMNVRTSREVLAAFGSIRAGEFAEAEEVFTPLSEGEGERRSVGLMGLAAVAYGRGDSSRALEQCQVSRELSDAPSYCWVIEGKIAFERGEVDKAADPFTRALADAGTLIDWQKAEAANGLGLVYMTKDEVTIALGMYDKAVVLDPTHTEAISNKARILDQKGDLDTALLLYQRGVEADPEDPVLALLLRDAQLRATLTKDAARQAQIATLASDLVAGSAKGERAHAARDAWTSSKLTVALLPMEEKGTPPSRLGETAFLESSLRATLGEVAGVEIVDRLLLDQVLEEMQMSTSALGEEKNALRVGEIMAARVLLAGRVVRMEGEAQVTLRLIETETTRVVASVNEIFESTERVSKVARALGDSLTAKVRATFPLRGRVTARKGKRVEINVGAALGAKEGERFVVLDEKKKKTLAEGRVVELEDGSAWLELGTPSKKVPKGALVERRL